jgi:phenylpyruvate tautomerase PptA (4-oxalocrotonate tautomerase family)
MPLVRIDVREGRKEAEISAIGEAVHASLVSTMNVPQRDRFHVVSEHAPKRMIYNNAYLGVERTDAVVFVQVFLSKGRTTEQKQAFYAEVARHMGAAGLRPQDLVISLVESTREDWSFGNGIAHYVVLPREEWK